MILSVQNMSKAYNEVPVLKGASFHIEEHDRAAIVGPNGCGKTTLIKIIVGAVSSDSGSVAISKDTTVGYLEQDVSTRFTGTVMDVLLHTRQDILDMESEMEKAAALTDTLSGEELTKNAEFLSSLREKYEAMDGYSYRSRVTGIYKGLGFTDSDAGRDADNLSGGEKMRVKLAQILLCAPDILIMDEPTNHLDMSSLEWLENYLKNYPGTLLVVSHDRYFLDRVVNKIIEIDMCEVMTFTGNYSEYAVKKEAVRTERMNAYLNQQADIKHQEEVIRKLQSYNREKSIKRAESRKKMLAKMTVLEKPREYNDAMKIVLEPCIESGKDVLSVRSVSKSFGSRVLFADQNIEIKRGEHVAIIGDNGTGKTTLLKMINGLELPDTGEIRNTLAAFLFTGDEVFKLIGTLSGGEKGRLSLAKLMLSEANLLILDEPTNHLDITSREILEDAINHYTGTVLYVSHDRYFIDRTAVRILELSGCNFTSYEGDYTYYLYKSAELKSDRNVSGNAATSTDTAPSSAGAADYQAQKKAAAEKRKRENELKKCEEEIERLENENSDLEDRMSDPAIAVNSVKLQELSNRIEDNNAKLSELMELWETLSED